MKMFWAIIAVLVVAAAVLVAMPRGKSAVPGAGTTLEPAPVKPASAPASPPIAAAPPAPTPPSQPIEAPAPEPAPTPPTTIAAAEPEPIAEPQLPPSLNELLEESLSSSTEKPAPATPDAPAPAAATTAPGAAAPMKLVTRDDGSMLVDDRFVVKGKGTKADPYEITWEYLISAQEVYKPRLGLKNLPERLDLVKDKYVRITGYIAFPIMAQDADEMLVMLNQWDGCCIGVPPTPYDAVEVKLAQVAGQDDRLAVYGTVTGRLGVEPYLVKDWLIGLYTMEDAALKAER